MIQVKFIVDGSMCSTDNYVDEPDKYRGLIECRECGEKAWFIKGFSTPRLERMACFASHHKDGCNASTVILVADDENTEQGQDTDISSSDITVDLDKTQSTSIYVSEPNQKHGIDESAWVSNPNKKAIGGPSGFPLNKSLRQLLTHLCKNPDYAQRDQTIKVVTDSERVIIDGQLKDFLTHIGSIRQPEDLSSLRIFWGPINNLNERDGYLWLNYGDYRTEPSVFLDPDLRDELLRNFKLSDVSELDGADIIIIGNAGLSTNGKIVIRTGFTKYLSFRRHKVIS